MRRKKFLLNSATAITYRYISFIGYCLIVIAGCHPTEHERDDQMPQSITVVKDKFVDNHGRQVILNGVNIVSKSKKENYIFPSDSTLYNNLKSWGFNSIRFGIIWDGLEPEPGKYNEAYLRQIDERIKWAGENGLFVILDMHQDLFSANYSDGAPGWATLSQGKPHLTGDVWSDSYLISPAVQVAFDNFWNNETAPDSMGLQDHYAALWKMLAKRYSQSKTVIGFDLMNEPFPGSTAQQAMPKILEAYGAFVYQQTGKVLGTEELTAMWSSADKRIEAIQTLNSEESFASIIDALEPIAVDFERNKLQPFYQKIADAIREVDQHHILFLEHAYFSNMGVRSSVERTLLPNGEPDPQVAYAPHGYDLVTDTDYAADASQFRMNLIFQRIKETGERLKMPIWLGEWGAYYEADDAIVGVAQHAVSKIEDHLFSNAYWSYEYGTENLPYFKHALMRPYPCYVNGSLENYQYDFKRRTFKMRWTERNDSDSPTIIYVPDLSNIISEVTFQTKQIAGSNAGWIIIPSGESDSHREIQFSLTR